MNAQPNNPLNALFGLIVFVIIASVAIGLLSGDPKKNIPKIFAWELKWLGKIGRWTLGHVFLGLAKLFGHAGKSLHAKKKKP